MLISHFSFIFFPFKKIFFLIINSYFFVVFNSAMLFDDKLLPIDKTHIKPESLEFFIYLQLFWKYINNLIILFYNSAPYSV